jgi:hypothetical protein
MMAMVSAPAANSLSGRRRSIRAANKPMTLTSNTVNAARAVAATSPDFSRAASA